MVLFWTMSIHSEAVLRRGADTGADSVSSFGDQAADSIRRQVDNGNDAFSVFFADAAVFTDETGFLKEKPGTAGKNIMRLLKGDVLYFQHDTRDGWTRVKINDRSDPKCCTRCNCSLVEGWVPRSSITLDSTASPDSFTDAAVKGREYVRNNYAVTGHFRDNLMRGEITAGMRGDMIKSIFGEPDAVNRTTGGWGVHEKWEYYGVDLYFSNGVLKSWQDRESNK